MMNSDFGRVNLLVFLAHLSEICFQVHPNTSPCISESDFDTTSNSEPQIYFRKDCPAFAQYKRIFEGRLGNKPTIMKFGDTGSLEDPSSAKAPLKSSGDPRDTTLKAPWKTPSRKETIQLSMQYITESTAQLADFLTQEFDPPLSLFECKHVWEQNLVQAVTAYIRMTEEACFCAPKILSEIMELEIAIEHQKADVFDGDVHGQLCATIHEQMAVLGALNTQVSKSLLCIQSCKALVRTLDVWAPYNPTIGPVQKLLEERNYELGKIQCFRDLSRIRELCLFLRNTCKQLTQMTEVVPCEPFCESSSETEDEGQVLLAFSSESETALEANEKAPV